MHPINKSILHHSAGKTESKELLANKMPLNANVDTEHTVNKNHSEIP